MFQNLVRCSESFDRATAAPAASPSGRLQPDGPALRSFFFIN